MSPQPQQLPIEDIHIPDAVTLWPPAYGWWILALLLIISIVVIVKTINKWRRARVQKNLAINALMAIDLQHYGASQQINEILKRAAIVYYGREAVASLTGQKWKDFLLEALGNKSLIFDDTWLSFAYCATAKQDQLISYHQFAKQWLTIALPTKGAAQ
jgi:hypothetical protein